MTVHRLFEDRDHPNDTAWMARGACRGMDPALFFPERGDSTAEAKATCRGCPVQDACFAYGMTQRYGIWGGLSERERRRLRLTQADAAQGGAA